MAFADIVEISQSSSLRARCVAAAAGERNISSPENFVAANWWAICAQPGWADAWAYARDNGNRNVNPDTGARDDVISDAMILAAMQSLSAS